MKTKILAILAGLMLALGSAWALAHHSTEGIYKEETEVSLTGKVKQWRFINPHPFLVIEVVGEDGVAHDYDVSYGGSAVAHLTRRGYTSSTFQVGETITLRGFVSKEGYGVLIRGNPVRADGTPVVDSPAPAGRPG
jgi:hypothetical protein